MRHLSIQKFYAIQCNASWPSIWKNRSSVAIALGIVFFNKHDISVLVFNHSMVASIQVNKPCPGQTSGLPLPWRVFQLTELSRYLFLENVNHSHTHTHTWFHALAIPEMHNKPRGFIYLLSPVGRYSVERIVPPNNVMIENFQMTSKFAVSCHTNLLAQVLISSANRSCASGRVLPFHPKCTANYP